MGFRVRGNDGHSEAVGAAPARRAWAKFIFTAYFTVCRAASERRAGEWNFRGLLLSLDAPLARVLIALAARSVPRSRPSSGFGLQMTSLGNGVWYE